MTVRGTGLDRMPALNLTTPVIARLVRDDTSACWEATFPTATRDRAREFRAYIAE